MIKGLYAVRDVKAGTYWPPIAHVNDEVAKREFTMLSKAPDIVYMASDLQLYKVGEYDDKTANIEVCNVFICNCVDVLGNSDPAKVVKNGVEYSVVEIPKDGDVNE